MKTLSIATYLTMLILASSAITAQQPATPAPDTPALTLEEKISLATDDLKVADALETAQKSYQAAIKPIQDHQAVTKKTIEKEHSGWVLEGGPQGWHFTKAPEEKNPTPAKAAAPAEKKKN